MDPGNNQEEKTTDQYLIIGGAPKSATTSLFRYLADHPETCPANRKETYFFARQFDYDNVCELDETLEAFETYFTHCDPQAKWRIEATPYTLYAEGAAQTIANLLPDATALFLLRDPIERLFSDYRFHVQREHPGIESTFEKFIEGQLHMNGDLPNLLELGCYIRYLRPFINALGQDKVLILFYEQFKANPTAEMRRLCAALGIDATFYADYPFRRYNRTINIRHAWLNRLAMNLEPRIATVRAWTMRNPKIHKAFEDIVRVGRMTYRTINDQGPTSKKSISAKVRARLIEYYQPYNQALSRELGRPLPWKPSRAPVPNP